MIVGQPIACENCGDIHWVHSNPDRPLAVYCRRCGVESPDTEGKDLIARQRIGYSFALPAKELIARDEAWAYELNQAFAEMNKAAQGLDLDFSTLKVEVGEFGNIKVCRLHIEGTK